MARPKLQIDENIIYELAKLHCTTREIASVIGCSHDTVSGRFSSLIEKGRDDGKQTLRRYLWKAASGGNVVAMIWLSKQHLGMTDKIQETQTMEVTVNEPDKLEERRKQIIDILGE